MRSNLFHRTQQDINDLVLNRHVRLRSWDDNPSHYNNIAYMVVLDSTPGSFNGYLVHTDGKKKPYSILYSPFEEYYLC